MSIYSTYIRGSIVISFMQMHTYLHTYVCTYVRNRHLTCHSLCRSDTMKSKKDMLFAEHAAKLEKCVYKFCVTHVHSSKACEVCIITYGSANSMYICSYVYT